MKHIGFILIGLGLVAVAVYGLSIMSPENEVPLPDEEVSCVCTKQYDPVCGVDGKTYGNACTAGCAKVAVKSAGECSAPKPSPIPVPAPNPLPEPDMCVCTMQYDPVCGVDGKTYGNACGAACAKVSVDYKGECGGGE